MKANIIMKGRGCNADKYLFKQILGNHDVINMDTLMNNGGHPLIDLFNYVPETEIGGFNFDDILNCYIPNPVHCHNKTLGDSSFCDIEELQKNVSCDIEGDRFIVISDGFMTDNDNNSNFSCFLNNGGNVTYDEESKNFMTNDDAINMVRAEESTSAEETFEDEEYNVSLHNSANNGEQYVMIDDELYVHRDDDGSINIGYEQYGEDGVINIKDTRKFLEVLTYLING